MNYDIIIVGSGIVGATAALALAKNPALKIAVIEAKTLSIQFQKEKYDYRVSAISLGSKKIFQEIDVWEAIQHKRVSSYKQMHVWDAETNSDIHFNCAEVNEDSLGYIIEDSVMRSSLLEKMATHSNIHFLSPLQLISLQEKLDAIELLTDDQKILSTKLLVAADGANSWVRDQVKIELKTWDYHHTAIVTTVKTEFSHQQTAWQRFLPTGPLAFLPLLDEQHCSIVWSAKPDDAEKLLAMNDEDFSHELESAFQKKLGKIISIDKRFSFPLRMRHAKNYVKERIALIGDAAHTIHPLAGQGVNLGLQDAAALSNVILDSIKKHRDFPSFYNLRRYERARKSNNVAMLMMVEFLKNLFGSEKRYMQHIRSIGLNTTNKIGLLKNFFVAYALGKQDH